MGLAARTREKLGFTLHVLIHGHANGARGRAHLPSCSTRTGRVCLQSGLSCACLGWKTERNISHTWNTKAKKKNIVEVTFPLTSSFRHDIYLRVRELLVYLFCVYL